MHRAQRDGAVRIDLHLGVVGVADHAHPARRFLDVDRSGVGDQLGEVDVDGARGRGRHVLESPAARLGVRRAPGLPALVCSDVDRVRGVVDLPERDALLERAHQGEGLEGASGLAARLDGQIELVLPVVRSADQDLDPPFRRVDGGDGYLGVALERVALVGHVAEGRLPGCARVRCRRQVDLLALSVQCLTGKRHQVFPAEQSADPDSIQLDCHQRASVALPPDSPLLVRGHQLPVMQHQFAAGIEYKQGVVEGPAAVGALPFGYANRQRDAGAPRGLGKARSCGPRNIDRVGVQAREGVGLDVGPPSPQPYRVAWNA